MMRVLRWVYSIPAGLQRANTDIYAVFAGKDVSLLSAENNFRIGRYYEFGGRDRLINSLNS